MLGGLFDGMLPLFLFALFLREGVLPLFLFCFFLCRDRIALMLCVLSRLVSSSKTNVSCRDRI